MANSKRMRAFLLDDSTADANTSSPIRRKSLAPQVAAEPRKSLTQNDDESEILARRQLPAAVDNRTSSDSSLRRVSLGVASGISANEITEHYHKCIKLCTENKINSKNAFALSIIDYMAALNRRDHSSTNMQTASTTLDVSTKIYGVRVDCVHSDVFKMVGDSGKKNKDHNRENGVEEEANTSSLDEPQVKRKRRSRLHNILVSAESLSGTPELLTLCPSSTNTDSQTTDTLLQVSYPIHAASGHALHLYEDVLLDSPPTKTMEVEKTRHEVPMPFIPDFQDLDICPMFADFHILGWSEDDIPSSPDRDKSLTGDNLRFDMDASLHDAGDHDNEGMNFFDLEDASQENIDRCARRPEQTEHIVDFRESAAATEKDKTYSEYSYLQKTHCYLHWAGPAHWKPRLFPKVPNNSKVVGSCRQGAIRKKKELELEFHLSKTEQLFDILSIKIPKKLQLKTLRQAWHEDKITLPEDVHYDDANPTKFYYHSLRVKRLLYEGEPQAEADATLVEDEGNYDYANENDMQNYSSQHNNPDDCDDIFPTQEPGYADNEMCTQAFTGDNLVAAPKSTAQIRINYSTRAKKVDMRQLKDSIWKTLTLQNTVHIENEEGATAEALKDECSFGDTYKKLPTFLGRENAEALSPALAFVSLLHLANDRTLEVKSTSDMSDLKISQG